MKNFWDYLQERFPPLSNGLLIVSYFTANYLLARAVLGQPLEFTWRWAAGGVALLFMFFHLRVIDEHKDYARDCVVHPQRVLSRGRVTLTQLRRLGLLAAVSELLLSVALGLPALLMALLIFAFSLLIYKEFYASRFLQRHMFLNAFVHLLIMPVYSLYVFAVATGHYPWEAPLPALGYAWVSYGVMLGYELARKTRAPHDERPGLLTYSSYVGPYVSALAALGSLGAAGLLSTLVGSGLHVGLWYHVIIAGLLLAVAGGFAHFCRRVTTANAARLQNYAGLFIFAFDVLLAVELIRLHGVGGL